MDTRIDKFGRVVIPKSVRDHLGLKTGAVLRVEEGSCYIVLSVAEQASPLEVKKGIVVHTGQAQSD